MLFNLTYVPKHRRLEGRALGFVLTSDPVASAGVCVNEFVMLNTSQLAGPFCFLHTRLQSACLCSLRLSEAFTSDTLTLMSPLIRMVEGAAQKHISWQRSAGRIPEHLFPAQRALLLLHDGPSITWPLEWGLKQAEQLPSCAISLSNPLKSPLLFLVGLLLWIQLFFCCFCSVSFYSSVRLLVTFCIWVKYLRFEMGAQFNTFLTTFIDTEKVCTDTYVYLAGRKLAVLRLDRAIGVCR